MSRYPRYIHEIYTIEYQSTVEMKIPIQLNQYKIDKIILEYHYKCVVVSATSPNTSDKLAIKCIPIELAAEDRREVELMKLLNHPNIIKYVEDFYYPAKNTRFFAIVMPRAISDLLDYLNTSGPFKEALVCQIMRQSLNAINYLHANHIWHRDVKLDNILILREERSGVKVNIIDFGLSDIFDSETYQGICTGTIQYAAPELLYIKEEKHKKKRLDFKKNGEYNNKIDSWGLGVVLYSLISGILPFDPGIAEDVRNLFLGKPELELPPGFVSDENNKSPLMRFQNVSEECKDLICQMLCADPNFRISTEEAIQHPWFLLYNDDEEGVFAENREYFDAIEDIEINE